MAEAGTKRQQSTEERSRSSQSSAGTAMERRSSPEGGRLERAGGYSPSFFSVSPGEFFTLSPISLMRRLTEDIDRAFGFGGLRRSGSSQQDFDWIPPVELRQEGNNLVARVDLPGMDENDIKVEVTEDGLEISGEREQETTSEEGGTRRSEISYGRFYRLIPLPESADTENAKANFQKGVLEVTIPVSHAQQTRKSIPISTSAQSSQGATQGSQETRSRAATSST